MIALVYLFASFLFIFGIKNLNRIRTARRGNLLASLGMLIAIVATLVDIGCINFITIFSGILIGSFIGAILAFKVQMTAMPQLVAIFNGFGGLASSLVALAVYWKESVLSSQLVTLAETLGSGVAFTIPISIFIGAITFTGSMIAFLKLNGKFEKNLLFESQRLVSLIAFIFLIIMGVGVAAWIRGAGSAGFVIISFFIMSGILGIFLVTPIGGADMPVVISLLNSYSGLAAAATGFVLNNQLLIVSGSLVGASGLILTSIMCKAMNRSLLNVCFGGLGTVQTNTSLHSDYQNVKSYTAEEAAMMFDNANSVIVVPGYGLAVSQAQHSVREFANLLEEKNIRVRYAIHPVAGRMPGHMNVLLAEANVPYEQLFEMEKINADFKNTDVVLVIGANDVVNPTARVDSSSPIYGMPILDVDQARTVLVIKRSLSPGYAGIKNPLFENDNTMMLFGDGKKMIDQLFSQVRENL